MNVTSSIEKDAVESWVDMPEIVVCRKRCLAARPK